MKPLVFAVIVSLAGLALAATPTVVQWGGTTTLTAQAAFSAVVTDPQVCVGATPTVVPSLTTAGRTMVPVQNQASAAIWCSTSSGVTASAGTAVGISVAQGQISQWALGPGTKLYCISAGAQTQAGGCTTVLESVP